MVALSTNLFISSGLSGSCGMAFLRLIFEERSDAPPEMRSFHHFLIRRMTRMALFFAVVPISGYFSSSSASSSPFLFFFLFSSINKIIFVRSGRSDSSNWESRLASFAEILAPERLASAAASASSSSSSSSSSLPFSPLLLASVDAVPPPPPD